MITDALGALWQPVLTFVLLLFLALPSRRLSRSGQLLLIAALTGIALVRIEGIALAIYLRSVIDDLAITTVLALCLGTLVRLGLLPAPSRTQQMELLLCFGTIALFLYPSALGLTFFDPYRLGFSPRVLVIGIGLLTLIFLLRNNLTGVLLLSAATLAFSLGMKESTNYWDYLIDPGLATYCLFVLLWRLLRGWRHLIPPAMRQGRQRS